MKGVESPFEVEVKVWEKDHEEEGTSKTFTKELNQGSDEPVFFRNAFTASTTHCLKMRIIHQEMNTQWSDEEQSPPVNLEERTIILDLTKVITSKDSTHSFNPPYRKKAP